MKITKQSHKILYYTKNALQIAEKAGRTCYKSEDKITEESAIKFVKKLISKNHGAMIEFGDIIVKFITNRGVTHELVRHRLCSFAQESTRYVNYGGKDIEFIEPVWWADMDMEERFTWKAVCGFCETQYNDLLALGQSPQQARDVLPNSLKAEIIMKGNIREWRHIFKLRCSKAAHPQIRALMLELLAEVKEKLPGFFDDI